MEGDHGQESELLQGRKEFAGGNGFMGRLPGIHQEVAGEGQEGLSAPQRSRMGICLSCWHKNAVSFWRNDFHRSGELQWRLHLWQWQERRESKENYASR